MDSDNTSEPIQMPSTDGVGGDGFGGPNISYEKFGEPEKPKEEDTKINVNLVNGNGVVSGKKMVSSAWRAMTIIMLMVSISCIAGVAYSFMEQKSLSQEVRELSQSGQSAQGQLNSLEAALGVTDAGGAIEAVTKINILDGDDIESLQKLIGDNKIDFTKNSLNFIQRNGQYTVASLNLGGVRTIYYKDIADGVWKKAAFDASKDKHCEKSSEEELRAIRSVVVCNADEEEPVEEEE